MMMHAILPRKVGFCLLILIVLNGISCNHCFSPKIASTTNSFATNFSTLRNNGVRFAKKSDVKSDKEDYESFKSNIRRALLGSGILAWSQFFYTSFYAPPGFERLKQTQFIAALGPPKAQSGSNAQEWGLWREDPGPPGVPLKDFEKLSNDYNGRAPAGWVFNNNDWWLEEHGLIMPAPDFPVPAGRYLVTGGRTVITTLTIGEKGEWSLENGSLYDVTHLPCRSARYQPENPGASPANANKKDFPVFPGAAMPSVAGCSKQDYAVLFLIGKEKEV